MRKKGYSLVEIVIVAGIASLFASMVFRFYAQSNKSQVVLIEGLQLQSSVVSGVNKTMREIRSGISFIVPELDESIGAIVFTDNENNFKAIYALENEALTKRESTPIYDLFCYTTNTETYDVFSPVYDIKQLKLLCSDIKNISFRLSSARAVSADFVFQRNGKEFQVVAEGALMNIGGAQ